MDRNIDFNGFSPFDNMNFDPNVNPNVNEAMFNPIIQYEQAYMYYRYLTQQLDYKIKCKEYEKLCHAKETKERKIE